MEEILSAGFSELGLEADGGAVPKFIKYYEHLAEKSACMNLTAIKGEEATARLHFLDCCALLGAADFRGKRVIDVGAGAGFPGLPLLIAEPGMRLTALDSQQKRVDFLRETGELLGLENLEAVWARAEEAPPEYRESFDIAVSRAVARLSALCEICLPFVRLGGLFIAMKGPEGADELREAQSAITLLGGEYERTFEYDVPGAELSHCALLIRKTAPTPEKYPRRWAKITKQPL